MRSLAAPALLPTRPLAAELWPAAHAAVSYAYSQPEKWRDLRVLELGAGAGLTGISLAALGAQVTVTDLPDVCELAVRNVARNSAAVEAAGGSAAAAPLSWGDAAQAQALLGGGQWDVLLACDVLYRRNLFSLLVSSLRALAGPGTRVLIACLKRWKWESVFWAALQRAGFRPRREVFAEAQPADGERRPVRIFETSLA